LRCVHKALEDVKVVICGAGAAGTAVADLLLAAGVRQMLMWDKEGILAPTDTRLTGSKRRLAEETNGACLTGDLPEALVGADVVIGVSAANVIKPQWLSLLAPNPVVFALANPDPEVDVVAARAVAAVVATGRSDYPNQINNVLAFPGVFRGLLDARARNITTSMLLSAAHALAAVVTDEQLNPSYVVPSVFDPTVPTAVAAAVSAAAQQDPAPATAPGPDDA
jgi:malate dehydrogenase (oxaloacetate-decarboxylating)